MGSKARLAKDLLPIILSDRTNQVYVEPFVGGCNMIDKISGPRIGNDSNSYLIAMWVALQQGWEPPQNISREQYNLIRSNKSNYAAELVGWVGFGYSYSGKFFGGYAGITKTKEGLRNYIDESYRNLMLQVPNIKTIEFLNQDYKTLDIPNNSIIYCDPPYQDTTKYSTEFNHAEFWDWCRQMAQSHKIYISEYTAPDDFEAIWSKSLSSSLSANGKFGGNKNSIEKLFIPRTR